MRADILEKMYGDLERLIRATKNKNVEEANTQPRKRLNRRPKRSRPPNRVQKKYAYAKCS